MDREKALSKINKLMNLASNEAASEGEVDNALRQAEFLMEKFAIDMSEAQRAGNKLSFDWQEEFTYFGQGNKANPIWYQWMAVAVANFTDTIVIQANGVNGAGVKFKGHGDDVIFAAWLVDHLKEQLRRATRDAKCGSPENRETFRKAFARGVCIKVRDIREQRDQKIPGNALIIVNTKIVERDEHFGGVNYRTSKTRTVGDIYIHQKGIEAGKKASLNRPVTSQSHTMIK